MTIEDLIRDIVRQELDARLRAPTRDTGEALLTIAQAAVLGHVSTRTVRREIKSGRLRGFGAGKLLRVRRGDVEKWLTKRRAPTSDLSVEQLAELADREDSR